MDWNKTNTVLIVAFIIVNLFLFSVVINNNFTDERLNIIDDDFTLDVKNTLLEKNITVSCDIPDTIYVEPFLEVEYQIFYPSKELIQKFLTGYEGPIDIDKTVYYMDDESLEIKDGKKIIYNKRKPTGRNATDKVIEKAIKDIENLGGIDLSKYEKDVLSYDNNSSKITFYQTHNNIGIANGYISLYLDDEGIYKFEMQKIINITESKVKKSVISAPEAILRLMAYDDIKDKDLVNVDIWYYNTEGDNWKDVNKINSDLTWIAKFSDGSYVYLKGED